MTCSRTRRTHDEGRGTRASLTCGYITYERLWRINRGSWYVRKQEGRPVSNKESYDDEILLPHNFPSCSLNKIREHGFFRTAALTLKPPFVSSVRSTMLAAQPSQNAMQSSHRPVSKADNKLECSWQHHTVDSYRFSPCPLIPQPIPPLPKQA